VVSFWALMDKRDWHAEHLARRRNCWFVCRYGKSGDKIDEIKRWPFSKLRQATADISFWLEQETKNSKRT
jgi:hypothetical protein